MSDRGGRATSHRGDGDWPADPSDPRCPTCGEPVSSTANYCMHCYEDLPGAPSDDAVASTQADGPTWSADDPGTVDRDRVDTGPTARARADPATPTAETPEEYSGWLHPDSAFDDVSTGMVGLVGGFLDGFLLFLLFLLGLRAFPSAVKSRWAMAVGIVGWLVATAWIARTRTVFGAIRKAAYSFAGLVALAPLFVAYALSDPDALFFGVVAWPIAGIVAGVGWVAGRGAIDDEQP